MATAESVLAKIQALIDSANTTTGGSNTDLTAAINALIAGYNAGGLDTSDATATASDMANGVTAYVNGEKVTGSVGVVEKDSLFTLSNYSASAFINDRVRVDAVTTSDRLVRTGAIKRTFIPSTEFGDATAADVAAGKTFTSAAGLLVEGTNTGSGGGGSGGLVAKSGSFTGNGETTYTISTGLSSISYFMMQLDGTISSTGFVIGSISTPGGKFSYIHCSSYSQYVKNFAYLSMDNTVTGGDFTYSGSSASVLTGTISWVAIGTE